jgi:hypothetical protein
MESMAGVCVDRLWGCFDCNVFYWRVLLDFVRTIKSVIIIQRWWRAHLLILYSRRMLRVRKVVRRFLFKRGVREIVRVRTPKRHAAVEVIRTILAELRIKVLHHKFKSACNRLIKTIVFLQRRWRRVRIHLHWRRYVHSNRKSAVCEMQSGDLFSLFVCLCVDGRSL